MKIVKLVALLAIAIAVASCSKSSSAETDTGLVIDLTTPTFKTLVADPSKRFDDWQYLGDKPAIVVFHATWCPNCTRVAPILVKLSVEYGEEIYVYKVDTDLEEGLANAYYVTKLPTILFVPMVGDPTVVEGAITKRVFESYINSVMLNKE